MADSKNCEMEASERSRSIKETEENVTITYGDELMNTNLHVANESEKTIPSNEDVDITPTHDFIMGVEVDEWVIYLFEGV